MLGVALNETQGCHGFSEGLSWKIGKAHHLGRDASAGQVVHRCGCATGRNPFVDQAQHAQAGRLNPQAARHGTAPAQPLATFGRQIRLGSQVSAPAQIQASLRQCVGQSAQHLGRHRILRQIEEARVVADR